MYKKMIVLRYSLNKGIERWYFMLNLLYIIGKIVPCFLD